jgi:outer membrane protein
MTRRGGWVVVRAIALMSLLGYPIARGQTSPTVSPAAPSRLAPAGALTLDAAVSEALQRRPLLAGDAERLSAARARITQARAALLPRLDLQASATDGPLGAPPLGLGGLVGTPIKKHTGGSLNLVQTLLDFGRSHNTVQARRAEATASQETLHADQDRVELEVQQAYLQVLQAQRLRDVNRQILEQRRLVARQAETLQQNGLASRVDVDLAEFNASQAELAVTRAQNDLEVAFAALGTALGRPVPPTTVLQDVVPQATVGAPAPLSEPSTEHRAPSTAFSGSAPSLEDAIAAGLRDRPELRQVAAQVQAAEHLEAAARAGKRPLLSGVGSVGKINPVPLFKATDKPFAVGVALTVPIFTGGLVEGQVEEARRNAAASRANLEELTNQVRQQVTSAVSNIATAEESIRVAQAQLVRAQDALSLATQRYQAQLGSIVELTQAQVSDATAQNDFVRAVYDRELARAALDFATGRSYHGAAPEGQDGAGNQRGNQK